MGKLKHIELEGHAYFVTTNVYHAEKILSDPRVADIVLSAIFFLRGKEDLRLYAFVIMSDHLHLIILPQGGKTVSQIMHSLKSYTAKKINRLLGRSGKVWQDGFYERVSVTVFVFMAYRKRRESRCFGVGRSVEICIFCLLNSINNHKESLSCLLVESDCTTDN